MKNDLTVVEKKDGTKEYMLLSRKLEKDLLYDGILAEGGVASSYKFVEKENPGAVWVVTEYRKPDSEAVKNSQANLRCSLEGFIRHMDGKDDEALIAPIEILDFPKSGTFGYIMPYVDLSKYRSLPKLLRSNPFPDTQILYNVGMNLSRFFAMLHQKGLCCKNLEEENIYLNPVTGEVRIIANDNIGIPDSKTILGVSQYCAPEIFTHQVLPDRFTDCFQLATYFLRLFTGAFPMEGRFMMDYCRAHGSVYDQQVANVVLGEKAIFVFNESDTSNALPEKGDAYLVQRKLWESLPAEIKEGFSKTFVDGLAYENRYQRTTPSEWERIFIRLSGTLV